MIDNGYRVFPTEYGGVSFRSRTEARWAVFFDYCKIRWTYEPETFKLSTGLYLPDFYLHGIGYAEVKGKAFTDEEVNKCVELSAITQGDVLMLYGPPEHIAYKFCCCGLTGEEMNFMFYKDKEITESGERREFIRLWSNDPNLRTEWPPITDDEYNARPCSGIHQAAAEYARAYVFWQPKVKDAKYLAAAKDEFSPYRLVIDCGADTKSRTEEQARTALELIKDKVDSGLELADWRGTMLYFV